MKKKLLEILRCPECGSQLRFDGAVDSSDDLREGFLACPASHRFPIVAGIPRFVPPENYAANFGFQWNHFKRTQLDRHSGTTITRERFFAQSGWTPAELKGRLVLDVGCGAGRFADIALSTGAIVIALDYSSAIDAAVENLGSDSNLHAVQGDIFKLPFAAGVFDFVYCFGVLQHTPDVERAFAALPKVLKKGGRLAVDVYPWLVGNIAMTKYWFRPVTKRIPHERLFGMVQSFVRAFHPFARKVARVPVVGRKLRHVLPISVYDGVLPLDDKQLLEWSVLDTFDMLAPAHDHPKSVRTLRRWFTAAGLHEVETFRLGVAVGRARK